MDTKDNIITSAVLQKIITGEYDAVKKGYVERLETRIKELEARSSLPTIYCEAEEYRKHHQPIISSSSSRATIENRELEYVLGINFALMRAIDHTCHSQWRYRRESILSIIAAAIEMIIDEDRNETGGNK